MVQKTKIKRLKNSFDAILVTLSWICPMCIFSLPPPHTATLPQVQVQVQVQAQCASFLSHLPTLTVAGFNWILMINAPRRRSFELAAFLTICSAGTNWPTDPAGAGG